MKKTYMLAAAVLTFVAADAQAIDSTGCGLGSMAWHGLPEFICAAITLALHFWRRSMLISIVGGTVAYMFLIQKIF